MSLKLKVTGLTLLAALTAGSLVAWTASADTGGHLVSNVEHTIIRGAQNKTHPGELKIHVVGTAPIVCQESGGEATITSTTVTEVTVTPYWRFCETEGGGALTVFQSFCHGRATIAPGDPASTEHTADLVCQSSQGIVIEHPNCMMVIPPQNNIGDGTALRVTDNGRHAITAVAQAEFNVNFEKGICTFLGTSRTGTAIGSAVIRGFNTAGEQVSITTT